MKSVIHAKISRLIYPKTPPFFAGTPIPVFIKTLVTDNYDEDKVYEIIRAFNEAYPIATEYRVDVYAKGHKGRIESRRYNLSEV